MNTQVAYISGGVLGGVVSNGIASFFPKDAQQNTNPIYDLIGAAIYGFGATKVTGTDTKYNMLKGALVVSAAVSALKALKSFSEKNLSSKLQGTGAVQKFMKGAVGLGCPCTEGLNGSFVGADGQLYAFDDSGLSGTFVDEAGNIFQSQNGLNAPMVDEFGTLYDDGLNGEFIDEIGHVYSDGLNGEEEGLNGEEAFVYAQSDDFGLTGESVYTELYN